jgi:tripeptide aminopeptidase
VAGASGGGKDGGPPLYSDASEPLKTSCLERFVRYVTFDTQADPAATSYPSTAKQLDLLRQLKTELEKMGLSEVEMDSFGYVTATLPSNSAKPGVPVVAFVAHVDTSPDMPGGGVKPIVHRNYQGGEIALPDDPAAVLTPEEFPELRGAVGHDIVTASGTTLLGADDKAGVAEIMAAVEHLVAHPEIVHGRIRIAFTPDEEVGRGVEHFDVVRFGADYAYTLDGGAHGHVEAETFSADSMTVTFQGRNTHPGYAKGKMVNSIKVAADFLGRLPKDGLSPETTEGYEGYVHPNGLHASVDATTVDVLIRDFTREGLVEKEEWVAELARRTAADWPGAVASTVVRETYRNMGEVLEKHPQVVEIAEEALRRVELTPERHAIRGGTDGSKLSFMGLPTPNLSSGQHNIHSRFEWADAWEMDKAVEVIVEICRLYEERA